MSLTELMLDLLGFPEITTFFKFIGGILNFFKLLLSKSISPDDLVLYKPILFV